MGLAVTSPPWTHLPCVGAFVATPAAASAQLGASVVSGEVAPPRQPAIENGTLYRPRVSFTVCSEWGDYTVVESSLCDRKSEQSLVDSGIGNDDGLVFELEEPGQSGTSSIRSSEAQATWEERREVESDARRLSIFRQQVLALATPPDPFQLQLLKDVQHAKESLQRACEDCDVHRLTLELERLGYDVLLRQSVSGGPNTNYLTNLRHEFAYVATDFSHADGSLESQQLLIEFNLRQHFSIASPTERYLKALRIVPDEFVGTRARLMELVSLLSFEVELAFRDRNMCLPPWRQARSLLSKWFPVLAKDEVPSVLASRISSAPCQLSPHHWLRSRDGSLKLRRVDNKARSCPLDGTPPGSQVV